MGTTCSCLNQDFLVNNEFKVEVTKKDLVSVICLQNVMRGYMERKRITGYTRLKFAKTSERRNKREVKIVKEAKDSKKK